MSSTLLDINAFYSLLQKTLDADPVEIDQREFRDLELKIYQSLCDLKVYAEQTKSEPRLRGPFPFKQFTNIIESSWHVFDALIVMESIVVHDKMRQFTITSNIILDNDTHGSSILNTQHTKSTNDNELSVLSHCHTSIPLQRARNALIGSVSNVFYTLSSGVQLRDRVPDWFIDLRSMRDQMMELVDEKSAYMDLYFNHLAGNDTIIT